MMQFKAFKPEAMNKIAKSMGYSGDMGQFQNFIEQDPARQQQMNMYTNAAKMMAQGGMVQKFAPGGTVSPTQLQSAGSGATPVQTNLQGTTPQFTQGNIVSSLNALPQQTPAGNTQQQALIAQSNAAAIANPIQAAQQQNQQQLQANLAAFAAGQSLPFPNIQTQRTFASPGTSGIGVGGLFPSNITQPPQQTSNYPAQIQPSNLPGGVIGIHLPPSGNQPILNPNPTSGPQPMPRGTVTNPQGTQAATPVYTGAGVAPADTPAIGQYGVEQVYNPALPIGGTTIASQVQQTSGQDIAAGTGALTGQVGVQAAQATTATASPTVASQANTMQAVQAAPAVDSAVQAVQAAQTNPNDPRAQVTAAQQTASSVGNLQAAQGQAQLINNAVQRQIQSGELITGTGVDATAAAAATAQTQAAAAQANPSQAAMVQDQLASLMTQFQGTNPPAWAAGAIRTANAQMAARGLGSSSLAGQAIVQAAMESALPIAQADAQTIAQFDAQNLSNRQQAAMLAAEQRAKFLGQEFDQAFQVRVQNAARISDIANQNFTADQQIQLENSRIANTMNLQNLSNSQALVMSEAAALAQLDTANLNNRQQAGVQNAQNFLQMDMANLSNRQQTDLFKSQQQIQALFTDQAAQNAANQFNASSQNQVDQFFANLASQTSQFNAAQANAQSQFNAGQENTVERFNAELNNQRDQFNAQNQLVIAQANAQWRRQIATADTTAINRANELNANAILDISKEAYDNLWQYYADTMEWAWKSGDNELDRLNNLAVAQLSADAQKDAAAMAKSSAAGSALGRLVGTLGAAWIGK